MNEALGSSLFGGVRSPLFTEADDGGDEAAIVLHTLVSAAARLLLLVLLRHFWSLASHLTSTSQRSVYLTWNHKQPKPQNQYNEGSRKQNPYKTQESWSSVLTHGYRFLMISRLGDPPRNRMTGTRSSKVWMN